MINIPKICKPISGSFTYLDAGGEQTIIEITGSVKCYVTGIIVDMVNFTQNGTFKFYSKIDGSNYRELASSQGFTVANEDGIILNADFNFKFPIDTDFKVTYTESVDEGSDRIMPYKYIIEG